MTLASILDGSGGNRVAKALSPIPTTSTTWKLNFQPNQSKISNSSYSIRDLNRTRKLRRLLIRSRNWVWIREIALDPTGTRVPNLSPLWRDLCGVACRVHRRFGRPEGFAWRNFASPTRRPHTYLAFLIVTDEQMPTPIQDLPGFLERRSCDDFDQALLTTRG